MKILLKNIINYNYISVLFLMVSFFSLEVLANEIPCSISITTEIKEGDKATIYIEPEVFYTNDTGGDIDAVIVSFQSKNGNNLFTATLINEVQSPNFYINPKAFGVIPIRNGDTSSLTEMRMFKKIEHDITFEPGGSSKDGIELYKEILRDTEEKYSDVKCIIRGVTKKMFKE